MSEAFSEVQRTFRQQIINPIHPALRAVILASLLCIYTHSSIMCYNQKAPEPKLRCFCLKIMPLRFGEAQL